MSLTAIIPTYRRPEVAARTAHRTLEVVGPRDACLVVAQGNAEEIAAVRAACGSSDSRLGVLASPEPNRSAARNLGILAAGTEWIAFLDDDALPRGGWRDAILEPLESGRADVVAGRLHEEPDRTTNAPREIGARLTWTGHTRRNYDADRSGPTALAPSGNMALGRGRAIAAGGFDPLFGGSAIYEDVEFSERLRRAGARLWYAADAVADHLAVRTGPWWEGAGLQREVDRARHMSLIFKRHRPYQWLFMAKVYTLAACWKVLRGRLPLAAVPGTLAGLAAGRVDGRRLPEPLEQEQMR